MILRSLTVSGLRCFRNPAQLNDFSEGINIIHGPNESGKSTLITGLALAFLDRHDMTGEAIEAFRPWGTSLSPVINAEFTFGGKRYCLEKGFLDNARSTLSEWDGRRYQRLDEGKAADNKVRRMMQAEFSGRGLSKNTQWGLAHLLWMPQGADRFHSLSLAEPGIEDYFRQAMGATLFSKEDDKLLGSISKRYSGIFTPKTGGFKANSEVSLAEQEVKTAKERLDSVVRDLEAIREAETDLLLQNSRLEELEADSAKLKQERKALKGRIDRIRELESQRNTMKAQLQSATQAWETVKKEWQQVDNLKKTIAAAESEIAQKEKAIIPLNADCDEASKELNSKRATEKDLEKDIKETNQEFQKANDLQQAKNRLESVAHLASQVQSARDLNTKLADLEKELSKQPCPGIADVKSAEKSKSLVDAREAEARAQGLAIDVTAYSDFNMTVSTSEEEKTYTIRPDEPLSLASADRMTLDIRGLGRIEIRSGSADVKKLLKQIAEEKKALKEILDKYGVATLSDLKERYDWGLKQNLQLNTLRENLQTTLGPGNTLRLLESRLQKEEKALQEQCSGLGVTQEELAKAEAPDVDVLKNRLDGLNTQRDELVKEVSELDKLEKSLSKQVAKLEQEISNLRTSDETSRGELKRRLEPYDSDEEKLKSVLADKEKEKTNKENELAKLEKLIPKNAAELERGALKLDREIKKLDEETIPEVRDSRAVLRGKLDEAGNRGLYSEAVQCEEALEIAQGKYQVALKKAQAIRLLHYLGLTRKSQLLDALTEPIRDEATRIFQLITDSPGRSIELRPDLQLEGIRVGEEDSRAIGTMEEFSIGTQEQLMMSVRLALGHFLGQVERQLVVLDDPLVNTDSDRLQRILRLLEAASETLQIVILTCHIDSYQDISGKRFDIRETTL
jgi:DNA repair exonuclease SbcCD ATPase subunit